jgi:hypothetical protein
MRPDARRVQRTTWRPDVSSADDEACTISTYVEFPSQAHFRRPCGATEKLPIHSTDPLAHCMSPNLAPIRSFLHVCSCAAFGGRPDVRQASPHRRG